MALGHWATDYLGPHDSGPHDSGGGRFVIEVYREDTNSPFSPVDSSITYQDVIAAWEAGQTIVISASEKNGNAEKIEAVISSTMTERETPTLLYAWGYGFDDWDPALGYWAIEPNFDDLESGEWFAAFATA